MRSDEKEDSVNTYNKDDLIKKAQNGDESALEEIVLNNTGLVKSIAKRFLGRGVEFCDLVQIGSIGLIKAVKGFNTAKECKLSTYAVPMIIGEIKRFLRDDNWIKISRDAKKNAINIMKFTEDYEKRNGIEPSVDVISRNLGISKEDIAFSLEASRPQISLYDKDEETGFSPENIVGTDGIETEITQIAVREIIDRLDDREKELITFRYFRSFTQSETARLMNISQVKVSRYEKKILEKMKKLMSA